MKLRELLRNTAYELGLRGFYTHNDVIETIRKDHPNILIQEAKKLEDIALRRLLNDVEAKQSKSYDPNQLEMFWELDGLPNSYDAKILGLADERGSRVPLRSAPIRSLRAIVSQKRKEKITPKLKIEKLLEALAPFIVSEDECLSDVLRRSRG